MHDVQDESGPLDAQRGRTDPVDLLRKLLPGAPPAYLDGALGRPDLDEEGVGALLRNPAASANVLVRIGRVARWTRSYDVKRGLVRHARTPLPLARRFLAHLLWADLADAAADTRLSPLLRRQAEEVLKVRLSELSVGEAITLARRASPGVVTELAGSRQARVLAALLGNPRVRERDVVRIAAGREAPPDALRNLAHHPVWGERQAVRLALLRNPRTPVPDALHVVSRLSPEDLERTVRDEGAPRIVQIGAGRRLASVRP